MPTPGDQSEARALFKAWRALSTIQAPSARVIFITQELRHSIFEMGFRIQKGILRPRVLNTSARSRRQMP